MGREFIDYTGEKFGDWVVLKCTRHGGKKPSMWKCRHKCSHEQDLRIAQLKSGRPTLCGKCGRISAKTHAARLASEMAAKAPRPQKAGGTLIEQIDRTKEAVEKIGGFTPMPFTPDINASMVSDNGKWRRRVKVTPWQIGLEQARSFSHFNF